MKNRIRLDTGKDAQEFANIVSKVKSDVFVTDGDFRVNGKSFLGLLYGMTEFENIWVECEEDIYTLIEKFIIN